MEPTTHLVLNMKDRSKVYDVFNPIEDPILRPAIFNGLLLNKSAIVSIDVSKEKVTVKTIG